MPYRTTRATIETLLVMVETLNPPWIQAMCMLVALTWTLCLSIPRLLDITNGLLLSNFGWDTGLQPLPPLIRPEDAAFKGMAVLFTDWSWGLLSAVMVCISMHSIYHPDRETLRWWTLTLNSLYCAVAAYLILVAGALNRPTGWLHLIFAVLAGVGFMKPLLRHFLKSAYERTMP